MQDLTLLSALLSAPAGPDPGGHRAPGAGRDGADRHGQRRGRRWVRGHHRGAGCSDGEGALAVERVAPVDAKDWNDALLAASSVALVIG